MPSRRTLYRKGREAAQVFAQEIFGRDTEQPESEPIQIRVDDDDDDDDDDVQYGEVHLEGPLDVTVPLQVHQGSPIIPQPLQHHDSESFKARMSGSPDLQLAAEVHISEQIADWASPMESNITHKDLSALLKILHPHFPDLPTDARTLLGTDRNPAPVEKMGKGYHLYLGIQRHLLIILKFMKHKPQELSLTFNIDGQSPYRNSKKEMWPILCKLDGVNHRPFIVSAYFGSGKPHCNVYLKQFVDELNSLLIDGLEFLGSVVTIKLGKFICDFPALSFIKNTVYSSSFVACHKCMVVGFSVGNTRVYHDNDARLRTDANFRSRQQADYHNGGTCLESVHNLNMIEKFVQDPMHLIFLNVVKKMCRVYREGEFLYEKVTKVVKGVPTDKFVKIKGSRGKNKMTAASLGAANKRIMTFHAYTPDDFARKLQPLSHSGSYKATECRQWILYLAPVVLKGLISRDMYEHMLLLHVACRIMSSKSLCRRRLSCARPLLRKFVTDCKNLLGIDSTSAAVHGLIHLPDDCEIYGVLSEFSAFPFENVQMFIRKLIRAFSLPLSQLWKRNSELEHRQKSPIIEEEFHYGVRDTVEALHRGNPTCGVLGFHYRSLTYNNMKLSLKLQHRTVLLDDGSIIQANNFIMRGGQCYVIGQTYERCSDFYPESSKVYVWKVTALSKSNFCWPIERVQARGVLYPLCKDYSVFMKLLHLE